MSAGLVIHVPHASTFIPPEYAKDYLLPPDELEYEVHWSADNYCDELFDAGFGTRVIAGQSRLVCDVERFRDDSLELMAERGCGLFYTHTLLGKPLRNNDLLLKNKIISRIYDPHHERLTAAVDNVLSEYDVCLIIDGHSFPDDSRLGENLPDFCIGADDFHTPEWLRAAAHGLFRSLGYTTETNRPFAGAITPSKHYHKEKRVLSLMVEVNRKLYLNKGTFDKSADFNKIKDACNQAVNALITSIKNP
jgi:N-formylglutamate amidohydrolase